MHQIENYGNLDYAIMETQIENDWKQIDFRMNKSMDFRKKKKNRKPRLMK